MRGWDFYYYSRRCRKHRMMAAASNSPKAVETHRLLARLYADRAARAAMG